MAAAVERHSPRDAVILSWWDTALVVHVSDIIKLGLLRGAEGDPSPG